MVANGVIPLEYYELQVNSNGKPDLNLAPMGDSFTSLSNGQLPSYLLEGEESDIQEWNEAISQRVCNKLFPIYVSLRL